MAVAVHWLAQAAASFMIDRWLWVWCQPLAASFVARRNNFVRSRNEAGYTQDHCCYRHYNFTAEVDLKWTWHRLPSTESWDLGLSRENNKTITFRLSLSKINSFQVESSSELPRPPRWSRWTWVARPEGPFFCSSQTWSVLKLFGQHSCLNMLPS